MLYRDVDSTRIAGEWENGRLAQDTVEAYDLCYEWKTIQVQNRVIYAGEVRYGTDIAEGYGIYARSGGVTHVGLFANGVPDGPGLQLNEDCSYVVGGWEAGVLTAVQECVGIAREDVQAVVWPPTDWPSKRSPRESRAPIADWLPSEAQRPLPAVEPIDMPVPVSDLVLPYYVSFDIMDYRDGGNVYRESVLIEQKTAQQFGAYKEMLPMLTVLFENDMTTFANDDAEKWQFLISLPLDVDATTVLDSQEMAGQKYLPVRLECVLYRREKIFIIQTHQALDTQRKPTDETAIHPGDEFHIDITSVSEDELVVTGTFSASWEVEGRGVKIENGQFRFTLEVLD